MYEYDLDLTEVEFMDANWSHMFRTSLHFMDAAVAVSLMIYLAVTVYSLLQNKPDSKSKVITWFVLVIVYTVIRSIIS